MFWCFKTINALHGKEVSQTHLEKRNTVFAKFLILSIDIEFSHFTVTHWQQKSPSRLSGVSDPAPSRIMTGLVCSLFCRKQRWKSCIKGVCCDCLVVVLLFFLLISRKISRLCILFLHPSARCSHGSFRELTEMLLTGHSPSAQNCRWYNKICINEHLSIWRLY